MPFVRERGKIRLHLLIYPMTTPEFTNNYPIAKQALIEGKREHIITKFENMSPLIEKSLEEKEIVSTKMADLKYYANHFVDDAYEFCVESPFLHGGKYQKQHPDMQYIDCPGDVRGIKSYAKKLTKVSPEAKLTDMYKAAKALTDELTNLFEVMDFLKEHTIKASDKKKQEMDQKKSVEDEWLKKLTSHKDSKKVIDLLKSTASSIEDKIYVNYLEDITSTVNFYKKKCTDDNTDYGKIFEHDGFSRMVIQSVTERYRKEGETYSSKIRHFKLVDNYPEILESQAKKHASDIVNQFVYKNAGKLSYIMYNKDNLDTVEIKNVSLGRGYVECDVSCKFKDTSEFIANTSVVLSYSKYDKPFYRYPTLFRNVKMPDGSPLSGPSEQKMDEVFALAKANNAKMKP